MLESNTISTICFLITLSGDNVKVTFPQNNPTSNSMPQNPETPSQQQTRRLPGSTERIYTAVVQLLCGFIAVTCGLAFILLIPGINIDDKERYIADVYYKLERFGIWGGLIFIATAIPYLFGRNKKCMVGLYFGFCLISAVIAAVGIGLSVVVISGISNFRSGEHCNSAYWEIHDENQCCFDAHYYSCDSPYDNANYYRSSRQDYNSLECQLKRDLARETVEDCRYEARQMYVLQLIFYGILLATVSVEVFASLYGASSALMAFCSCKCCCGRQKTPSYPLSSCQFVGNHGCISFTVPPPVAVQHSESTTINTTQIPQTSPPPYVPPTRLLGRPQNTMYEIPIL